MEPVSSEDEQGEMVPAVSEQKQEPREGDKVAPSSSETEQSEEDGEMVPASSQEEQGEEGAEITAAASEQHQETEERVQMLRTASEKKAVKSKIEHVLWLVEHLPQSIAALLEVAGPRRVKDNPERRAMEFMKMELADIVESLKSMLPPFLEDSVGGVGLKMDWLEGLTRFARDANSLVNQMSDSRLHNLLRRPAQIFRRSTKVLILLMVESFRAAEYANRYRYLLLAGVNSGPALPPCPDHHGLPPLGINRSTKKLLTWLKPQDGVEKRLRFMAIVGPAGVGKTTLAMEVHRRLQYQSSRGHSSFQRSIVAQVSNSTRRMEILLQDILSGVSDGTVPALSSDESPLKRLEQLVCCVQEFLQDKRYFILIDNLWHTGDWEQIKGSFPNNNLDSRVLITTRVTSIAWSCCNDVLVHEVKPLDRMDSARLFVGKAFGSLDGCPPDNMKPFCDKILMACQGIPLFITAMADRLKEQLQKQPQEEEEGDQISAIYSEEQIPQLLERFGQELSSAFDDMPSEFTTVLLSMSMFPYWRSTEKDHLILRWVSESHTSSPESFAIDKLNEVGEQYFSQLVDRNVITCVTDNCEPSLDEAQWHVHPFMMQFLAYKSAQTGFAFSNAMPNLGAATPRRLGLDHPDPLLPSLIQTMDLCQTRCLTISGSVSRIPLEKFVNLVSLDLKGWENFNDEDLEHICKGEMFVLEYLSIRNTRVSKLPHEINELRNLMILDASHTQISMLPLGVFELKRLYHLDLRGTRIGQLPNETVGLQNTLHTLLVGNKDIKDIINSIEGATRVPYDIQHFRALRRLATIDLTGHPASFIEALGDLDRLKVLAITWSSHQCIDKAYRNALLSSLKKLQICLESLTIYCGLGCSMEFLGALSDKVWMLKKLKVTAGRFASVPRWIDGLPYLAFVQITICKQGMDDLKTLGGLPKLQCLILGLDFIPREAVVIENVGFRELQRFSIDCPMPWLTFKEGSMRKLRYLQMKLCAFPTCKTSVLSGISDLPSLTEVALCYNPKEIFSPNISIIVGSIREAVVRHPNQIDFFINGIQDYDVQAVDEVTDNTSGTLSGTIAGSGDDDIQEFDQVPMKAVPNEITEA